MYCPGFELPRHLERHPPEQQVVNHFQAARITDQSTQGAPIQSVTRPFVDRAEAPPFQVP